MDIGSSVIKRSLLDLDPDYEDGGIIETKKRCLVEESGQEQAQQRMVEVVVRELDAALAQKESEALQLQERVQACQRDLHLLRFGITTSYYRNYLSCDSSNTSIRDEEQSPVHPAVLRLLGMSLTYGPKTRGVRCKSLTQGTSQEAVDGVSPVTSVKIKVIEQDEEKHKAHGEENEEGKHEPAPIKVPRYVPPNLPTPPEVCAASVRMERHRIKRRLVVGNVSKWLPEDVRESAATHKWMLYLRGPKDSPDVSDVVAKVRYFLHPSYRPHDIVDVVHPFYLARRGWGEFPVRVQVHFILQGNRPIDIIHNLKLDRTYSGLQTLGGETAVDVWLKQVSSMEDFNQVSGSNQEEKLFDTLPESYNSDNDWHETVVHESQKMSVATTQLKMEQQEVVDVQKGEEMKIKEEKDEEEDDDDEEEEVEDEEEDDDYDDGEEEDEEEEEDDSDEVVEAKEKDRIQQFHEESKETSKTYVASSEKGFVLHTLPDHDYLGPETFSVKCTLCVEQNNSDDTRKNQLKPEMMQVTNFKEPNWSSSMPPSLVLEQKSQKKLQTFPLNTVVSSDRRQTLVKKEEMNDATNLDCVLSVTRNGFVSNSSLVQCVDTEGNLFYIRLEKPTKCGIQKGMLNSSLDVQMQHPTGGSYANHVSNFSVEEKKIVKNNLVFQKNMGIHSSALLQTGRSLLKKNCVSSPPFVPSDSDKSSVSDKHIECRPPILRSPQPHLKEVPEEMDIRLKEAEQKVSRISNDQQAVIWILQQLPLADARVSDPEFKQQHPYCAKSVDVFLSWPVGKRHCAERLRANAAHSILQKSDPSRFAKWSVRHIIKWSRLHALTPVPPLVEELNKVENLPAISYSLISTVTEPSEVQNWLESVAGASKTAKEMEIVNVDELNPPSSDSKISSCSEETSKARMWIHADSFFGHFLRDTTAQLDIKLKPEMLCPGVIYPAAEELLNRACQSLCEDLLRRSMCQAWSRCKKMPSEIVLNDVQNAILSRPEFSVFTNDGLGVQAYDPFIDGIL